MITVEMMRKDPRLSDPFLRPDWRFKRVLSMISRQPTPGRTTKRDDEYIKDARTFLLRWKKGEAERRKLQYDMTAMYNAWLIYDKATKEPEAQFLIEARLLSGQSYDQIAFDIPTLPETIECYEKVFFNVKTFLPHHDWIIRHVLLPASDRFIEEEDDDAQLQFKPQAVVRPHFDSTLKFFAYFGGPILCEFMISGFKRGQKVHTQDGIEEFIHDNFVSNAGKRSAQAIREFEINKYNVMELFSTHLQIIAVQKSAAVQEDKHSTIEKHIHGMLTEIPWTVGKDAREVFEGTVIGALDEDAAELNSEELMLIGTGQRMPVLD